MFSAAWSWITPLLGAVVIFCAVLATTPPGFRALTDVLFASPRGPAADADAYALGAAASLALLGLILLAAACFGLDMATRQRR